MDMGVLYKDILQLTDIASHLKHHMQLNPFNDKYIATCPFHKGKSESMIIDSGKGTYDCLDCGENGDIIRFYMKKDGLSLKESLFKIASIENMRISSDKNKISFLNSEKISQAIEYFKSNIGHAKDFLHSKGYTDDAIDAFGIGYVPGNNSFMEYTKRNGIFEQMKQAGLIVKNTDEASFMGAAYKDLFSDMIIFPLYTNAERLIGLAGININDESDIKYFIDSSNQNFAKKRLLYGYNRIIGKESYMITDNIYETDLMQQEGIFAINPLLFNPESVAFLSGIMNNVEFKKDSKDLLKKIKTFEAAGIKTYIHEQDNGGKKSLDYIIENVTPEEDTKDIIDMISRLRDPIQKHKYFQDLASKIDVNIESVIESHGNNIYDKIIDHELHFKDNKKATYHHAAAFLAHVIRALNIKPALASSYMTDVPIGEIPDDESIFPKHLFELYRMIREKFYVKDYGFDLLYKERDDVMDFMEAERKKAKEDLIKAFEGKNMKPPHEVLSLLDNSKFFEKKYRSKTYATLKKDIAEKHDLPHEVLLKLQKPLTDDVNTHIKYLRNKIFLQKQRILMSDSTIDDASMIRELERLQRSI